MHGGLFTIEDNHGGHPNLLTIANFFALVAIMVVNLVVFYFFQYAQEQLAGVISDIQVTNKNKEEGIQLVVEEI